MMIERVGEWRLDDMAEPVLKEAILADEVVRVVTVVLLVKVPKKFVATAGSNIGTPG